MRPLQLADGVVFTCQSCGDCCRSEWLIGVDEKSHAALADVDWGRHDPALAGGEKFKKLSLPLLSGEQMTFARSPSGACVFLTSDSRCAIHRHLGGAAKPQVCREFPYHFVETPDGVVAGLSFACSAVRHHRGLPLADQRAEVESVLAGSVRVQRLPDPIALYSGVDIAWSEYLSIEEALLAILAREDVPWPRRLIAGSALLSLAVGLARIGHREGRSGTASGLGLPEGLAELKREGYRRLFELAAGVRAPRRRSLTHLAPLYAWLQLSRRPMSPLRLVVALYGNYLRFRRRSGRLPDLLAETGTFELAALQHVRFDADDAEVAAFLREYWSHVVARKTIVPMHGVFRGYHTLLVLHAFMTWMARLRAHREGRAATEIGDVREAVKLVEQRFVLHARFAEIFELSPVLTLLVDRLYRERGFVARAVL